MDGKNNLHIFTVTAFGISKEENMTRCVVIGSNDGIVTILLIIFNNSMS